MPSRVAGQSFAILGQNVRIEPGSAAVRQLMVGNLGAFASTARSAAPDLEYSISGRGPFEVRRLGRDTVASADGRSDLLYEVEKDVVLELQRRKPGLFFFHAGAIASEGRASLFVAESGSGKSTTTWGLLHHGFEYLSDEIAPISTDTLCVHPYPHAVCLKRAPPRAYPLPTATMRLEWSLHVPVTALPAPVVMTARPLDAIFLLKYDPTAVAPSVRPLSPAEAAARLFVNALNALAHPKMGLDAVLNIASHARCFGLTTARLPETCELVGSILRQGASGPYVAP
jgi:hypothetical protein